MPPELTRRQQAAELIRLEFERLLQGNPDEDNGRAMIWLELYVGLVQLDQGAVNDIVRPDRPAPRQDGTHPRAPSPAFGLLREGLLHDCMLYVMSREGCGRDTAAGIVAHDTGAARAEVSTAFNNREFRDGAARRPSINVRAGRVIDAETYARACAVLSSGLLPARAPDQRRKSSLSSRGT